MTRKQIENNDDYSVFRFMDVSSEKTNRIHDWEYVFSHFFGCSSKKEMRDKYAISGVYFLNGMYIGKSHNIKNRIKRHIINAITSRHNNNKLLSSIQNKLLSGEPMELMILSYNQKDETALIKSVGESIKLCNII